MLMVIQLALVVIIRDKTHITKTFIKIKQTTKAFLIKKQIFKMNHILMEQNMTR